MKKSKKSIFSNSDKANRAHKGRYSLVYAHYASSIPITHAYLMFRGNLQTFSLYPHFFPLCSGGGRSGAGEARTLTSSFQCIHIHISHHIKNVLNIF